MGAKEGNALGRAETGTSISSRKDTTKELVREQSPDARDNKGNKLVRILVLVLLVFQNAGEKTIKGMALLPSALKAGDHLKTHKHKHKTN